MCSTVALYATEYYVGLKWLMILLLFLFGAVSLLCIIEAIDLDNKTHPIPAIAFLQKHVSTMFILTSIILLWVFLSPSSGLIKLSMHRHFCTDKCAVLYSQKSAPKEEK